MALSTITQNVEIIQTLDNYPPNDAGMTSQKLKAKFDEGSKVIKTFINDTLIPELEAVETTRETAEGARVENEDARGSAETARASAESARVTQENARLANEGNASSGRIKAENDRVTAESARATAEESRVSAEANRSGAESNRVTAEGGRVTAEGGRVAAESTRAAFYSGFNASISEFAYVLKATDNLQSVLNAGKTNISLNPQVTYSFNGVVLPSGTTLMGNGATITSPDTTKAIFYAGDASSTGTSNIILEGIHFKGSSETPDNAASVATDVGVYLHASAKIKITNCRFDNFLGAGIACDYFPSAPALDYHMQQNVISTNVFHYCYYGIAIWNRAEYGVFSSNIVSYCRVGIWSQSGNWAFTGNSIFKCRAGFVSTLNTNSLVTVAGINPQHGSLVGNIVNHCRCDQSCGWATSNYAIGTNSVDYQGVTISGASGCIPPTFTGNTLYYSDLKYTGSASSGIAVWYVTGCVLSNMTISTDVRGSLLLHACTEQAAVTKTNVPGFGWSALPFVNGWEAYTGFSAYYRQDDAGRVYCRGTIGFGAAGTRAIAFPAIATPKPLNNSFFLGYSGSNSVGRIYVHPSEGLVVTAFTTFISLDQVEFDTL